MGGASPSDVVDFAPDAFPPHEGKTNSSCMLLLSKIVPDRTAYANLGGWQIRCPRPGQLTRPSGHRILPVFPSPRTLTLEAPVDEGEKCGVMAERRCLAVAAVGEVTA